MIRQHGALLTTEPLLYTPIRTLSADGQWLSRVVLSSLHAVGGIKLSLTLRTIVSVAVVGLLLRLCRDAGAGVRASAVAIWCGAAFFLPHLTVRPQLLAVIPFLVVLRACLRPPSSVVGALAVAATVVFWANVHGSFVLLFPLLGIGALDTIRRYRAGDRVALRPTVRLVALCGLAPLVNPYGFGLVRYVIDAVLFNSGGVGVSVPSTEFLPPSFANAYDRAFFTSLFATVGLIAAGRRPSFPEAMLLAVFGLLALTGMRYVLWWSLVLVPFFARALDELASAGMARIARIARIARAQRSSTDATRVSGSMRRRADLATPTAGSTLVNACLLVSMGLFTIASLPQLRDRLPIRGPALLDRSTPTAVAEYLAAHPGPGELFHATDWGSYFGWRLGPERKIFIDNRMELHPADVWRDYLSLSDGRPDWQAVLDRYGAGQLALDPRTQAGLVGAVQASPDWGAVQASPDWSRVYQDDLAIVFERRGASGRVGS